jgi:hypothetical protein
VIAYPDASFLCALYVAQSTSAAAIAHYQRMKEPLHVSALLLGEFRQSVRFQIFRNSRDSTQGYSRKADWPRWPTCKPILIPGRWWLCLPSGPT